MKNQVEFDRIVKTLTQKVKPGHEWQIDLSKVILLLVYACIY